MKREVDNDMIDKFIPRSAFPQKPKLRISRTPGGYSDHMNRGQPKLYDLNGTQNSSAMVVLTVKLVSSNRAELASITSAS